MAFDPKSIFSAYKTLKQHFPTGPETLDNSWLCQPLFYNNNFTRKLPNSTKTTFFGLPDKAHTLTVHDFYPNGKFIPLAILNVLTESKCNTTIQHTTLKANLVQIKCMTQFPN